MSINFTIILSSKLPSEAVPSQLPNPVFDIFKNAVDCKTDMPLFKI